MWSYEERFIGDYIQGSSTTGVLSETQLGFKSRSFDLKAHETINLLLLMASRARVRRTSAERKMRTLDLEGPGPLPAVVQGRRTVQAFLHGKFVCGYAIRWSFMMLQVHR